MSLKHTRTNELESMMTDKVRHQCTFFEWSNLMFNVKMEYNLLHQFVDVHVITFHRTSCLGSPICYKVSNLHCVVVVVFVVGLAERDRPIWACNVHCQMEAQKGNDRSMTPQQTRLLINVILLPYFLACFSMVRASSNNGGCLTIQVLWP